MQEWKLTRRALLGMTGAASTLLAAFPSFGKWVPQLGVEIDSSNTTCKETLRITGVLEYSDASGLYLRDHAGVWKIRRETISKICASEASMRVEHGEVIHVYVREGAEVYEIRKWKVNMNSSSGYNNSNISGQDYTDTVFTGLLQSPVHLNY